MKKKVVKNKFENLIEKACDTYIAPKNSSKGRRPKKNVISDGSATSKRKKQ